jgi:protocatechuate 3,4-dioxygenase beta subunit
MRNITWSCSLALFLAANAVAAPVKVEPLRGTVLSADGSPAGGAIVWAARHTYGPLERRETVADANGRFVLKLSAGAWFVWARHGSQGGEAPAPHEQITIREEHAPEPLTIRLDERGTLRGRLFEAETGKPVSGGQLFLDAGLVLTTNEDGRFEIGGLFRSHHEAFVLAAGRVRTRVLFDATAKADTELEVAVPRGGKIVGRVTDADGKPITGAYVGRSTSGSFFSINALYTECDADGRFVYDGVTFDAPTSLSGMAPGYQEEERSGLLVLSDGKPPELPFRLRPKPGGQPDRQAADEKRRVISGVVLRPDRVPAIGVKVMWGWRSYWGSPETRTDAAGRFRLTVPDKPEYLSILPRHYLPQFPHIKANGDQDIEIVLQPAHTVRGQVVDDAGKPIKDVHVVAVTGSPEPGRGDPVWLREADVRTDADGKFQMTGVPEHASLDFLKPGLSDLRNLVLKLDGVENSVTMRYGGAVFGRVVDRDGKPIRNFRVLVGFPLQRQAGDRTEGFFAGYSGIGVHFTSADGTFVLTGVGADCVYRIRALAAGHGEAVAERLLAVPTNRLAKTQPVTLQAGPTVPLRVRVQTEEGKQIAGARLTLVNDDNLVKRPIAWGYDDVSWANTVRGRTAADGWVDFPALSFGDAVVLIQASGFARYHVAWGNGKKEIMVELAPEAILKGEVRDATGQPVKDCYVNVGFTNGQASARIGRDDQGRFRFSELPAGPCQVTIRDENGRSMHQTQATLKAGETKEITIEIK